MPSRTSPLSSPQNRISCPPHSPPSPGPSCPPPNTRPPNLKRGCVIDTAPTCELAELPTRSSSRSSSGYATPSFFLFSPQGPKTPIIPIGPTDPFFSKYLTSYTPLSEPCRTSRNSHLKISKSSPISGRCSDPLLQVIVSSCLAAC